MPTITLNFEEAYAIGHQNKLWALRGHSINTYASLEHALSYLMSEFSGLPKDVANLIFFSVVNTQTRLRILNELQTKKYGAKLSSFWASLEKHLIKLTGTRNDIVHWTIVGSYHGNSKQKLVLRPPDYGTPHGKSKELTSNDLEQFIRKCYFVERHCRWLEIWLRDNDFREKKEGKVWEEIFSRPITYPPNKTHPLHSICFAEDFQLPPFHLQGTL